MVFTIKLVSVIIPVYRSEHFIAKCINAILTQTYPNIEIIVIYDPSPDNTLNILEEFRDRINLIVQSKKTNPAYARNMGLRISKGEYIAFCDSDDFFEPNKLEKQIGLLEKNSHIAVSYSDFTIIDENGKFINEIKVPEWDRKKWMRNGFITFSTVVIRRKVIKEIGGFNPYWDTSEDFDFLIRASSRFNFKRYPESLLKLTKHSKSLSTNIPKVKMNNNLILRIYKIKPFFTFFKDQFYWKLSSIFYYNTLRDKLPEEKRKLSYIKRFIGFSTKY